MARALAARMRRAIVHRDIKPGECAAHRRRRGRDRLRHRQGGGRCRGAAQERPRTADGTLTQVGTVVGTPAYMAPEQATGDAHVDHRADLYAWGVVAYELLAGRHPFADRTTAFALIGAHLSEVPAPLASVRGEGVPPALADVIARCLAKEPTGRPADAAALLDALDAVALTPTASPFVASGTGWLRSDDASLARTLAVLPW